MRKAKLWILVVTLSVLIFTVSALPDISVNGIWRDVNPTAYISPPANPALQSVYMLSPTEGWAVGNATPTTNLQTGLPAILHYDGLTWNLVPAPKFPDFPSNQSAYDLQSVNFGPPGNPISRSDGWAVGRNATAPWNATAIHWDGVTWRVQVAGLSGPNAGPLNSVFMVSSTDAWAVGANKADTAGAIWHWNGVSGLGGGWSLVATPPQVLLGVFMVGSTEGWAVGNGGAIFHYFGGGWTQLSSPVGTRLNSVFMLSATDGWAVGASGTILHYSSGTWSGPVSPGTTTNDLLSISMASSTDGWAVGNRGSTLHYSGGSWTALPTNLVPTSPVSYFNFTSVFETTSSDAWTVGSAGVILHFDGIIWGTVTSPTISNFTSVSFGPPVTGPINANDGWAVGNASSTMFGNEPTVYHWNGFMWTKGVVIGTNNNLNSVFMISSTDVWAVGGGPHTTASCVIAPCPVILHYTGGAWNTITPPPGSYSLKSVFMVSSDEGWAVGEQGPSNGGIILHYSVSGGVGTWATFPGPPTNGYGIPLKSLNSVFMVNSAEGWAVGDNATILHYTVTSGVGNWNGVLVSGTPGLSSFANLTSVFMSSPTDGWAVGGIQESHSSSAGAIIIHWDGTKWTPVATPSIPGGALNHVTGLQALLKSVFMTGPNDGWAVGTPGNLVSTLFHWDGVAWNHINTSPALIGEIPPILSSVYMTSPSTGWIVGSSPGFITPPVSATKALSTILRFAPAGAISAVTGVTATSTVVSTVSTSTTFLVSSFTSTTTNIVTMSSTTSVTATQSSAITPIPPNGTGIPGFPTESVLAGILIGLICISTLRRRRTRTRGRR